MKLLARLLKGELSTSQNKIRSGILGVSSNQSITADETLTNSTSEIEINKSLKEKLIKFFVDGNPGDLLFRDELFQEAAKIVVISQSGSITNLQQKLSISYHHADLIMDQLQTAKIVGPSNGSCNRRVLLLDEISLQRLLKGLPDNEKLDDKLISSFYEKNKREIELRKSEYEGIKVGKLKIVAQLAGILRSLENEANGNITYGTTHRVDRIKQHIS